MHRCYRYHQSRIRCQGGVGECMFDHSTIYHSGKAERNLVRLLLFLPLPFASKISPLPPVPTLALANFRPCLCLDILSIRSTWSKTCSCNGDNNIQMEGSSHCPSVVVAASSAISVFATISASSSYTDQTPPNDPVDLSSEIPHQYHSNMNRSTGPSITME